MTESGKATGWSWQKKAAVGFLGLVVAAGVGGQVLSSTLGVLGGGSSGSMDGGGIAASPMAPSFGGMADVARNASTEEYAPDTSPAPEPGSKATGQEHGEKVVKTGTLVLMHKDPAAVAAELKSRATGFKAFTDDESFTAGDAPAGYVVFRVPSERYEDFVAAMRKGYDVESLATQKSDMTKVYTESEARLASNAKELAAVEKLLSQAKTVQDVLAIRQQTAELRSENEVLRSQLSQIDDQASWSTLTVEVKSPAAISGEDYWGRNTVQSLLTAFQGSFRGMAVFLAALLPWLLAGGLAWGAWTLVARTRRRKGTPPAE